MRSSEFLTPALVTGIGVTEVAEGSLPLGAVALAAGLGLGIQKKIAENQRWRRFSQGPNTLERPWKEYRNIVHLDSFPYFEYKRRADSEAALDLLNEAIQTTAVLAGRKGENLLVVHPPRGDLLRGFVSEYELNSFYIEHGNATVTSKHLGWQAITTSGAPTRVWLDASETKRTIGLPDIKIARYFSLAEITALQHRILKEWTPEGQNWP